MLCLCIHGMTQTTLELATLAVDLLCEGDADDEPIIWPEEATPVLCAAIELVLLRGENVREELGGLLRVARVLELRRRSPFAASRIYRAIEGMPRALSALGIQQSKGATRWV